MLRTFACLAIALAVAGAPARAVVILTNGSFEVSGTPKLPGQGFDQVLAGESFITGWTVTGQGINIMYTYWKASDGNKSLDLNDTAAGGVQQTLATALGQAYRVMFDMAGNYESTPAVKHLLVTAGATSQTFTFNATGKSATNMGWQTDQFDFTATSTSTVLSFQSQDGGGFGPALDNVRLTEVPEPGCALVLAAGGGYWLGLSRGGRGRRGH